MKTYLEPDEIHLLERVTTNLRDCLLIRMLFRMGCRISEALTIGVEDIDFGNSAVSILHLKTRLKLSCPYCGAGISGGHTFCPKCGAKVVEAIAKQLEHRRQRVLPIDSGTLAMLKEYIERGGRLFVVVSSSYLASTVTALGKSSRDVLRVQACPNWSTRRRAGSTT